MKKWLFIIITMLILANPKSNVLPVQYQFDLIALIKQEITSLQSPKQRSNSKVKQELEEITAYFSDDEKEYLKKLTNSRDSLLTFYRNYCLQKDFNPILYGDHLQQTCKVIAKNRDLIR